MMHIPMNGLDDYHKRGNTNATLTIKYINHTNTSIVDGGSEIIVSVGKIEKAHLDKS